jgi:hypothetical protein
MAYYLDLFSPETYEAFRASSRDISGFRMRQLNAAKKIHAGDKLLCYMTKLSRWMGILEAESELFIDNSPIFYPENDPFIVRFKVKTVAWLDKEKAIPIHEDKVWNALSFTKGHEKASSTWTGKVRASLVQLDEADGQFIEKLILRQSGNGKGYPVDEDKYKKFVVQRVRRADKTVSVTVPEEEEVSTEEQPEPGEIRESIKIQALLAKIGEKMGFRIWLPRSDRASALQVWKPNEDSLLDVLPLNYDDTTLKTIEQIDVLWLKGRAIIRAFEVEHTTSVYSGILRMADLLALQPNMDINLHIVAPYSRRDKVFQEIQRPVFSLLDKGPLSEYCTFISYDSLAELAKSEHLGYLSDSVLEEYAEEPA